MNRGQLPEASRSEAGSSRVENAQRSTGGPGRCLETIRSRSTRSASAAMALLLSLTVLALSGCNRYSSNLAMENGTTEPPEMDVLLLSDLLRFYLDGEMEVDRGISDCYEGLCVQTDGERVLRSVPAFYVFAGHHDDYIFAHEETIENRNGIMIGDISLGTKDLPDIPNFAGERTITGYGGWGEFHGFDALYYGYVRHDRPQRVVEASLGGYGSEGNPVGGTLTWSGAAVGVDYSVITEDRVLVGNSELTVFLDERLTGFLDQDEYLISVDITGMVDVATGKTYEDMSWPHIPLRAGEFETFEVKGRFFGPNHEEVGGVFERNQIMGAFGATREEPPMSD